MLTQHKLNPKSDKQDFLDRLKYGQPKSLQVGPNIQLRIDSNFNVQVFTFDPTKDD